MQKASDEIQISIHAPLTGCDVFIIAVSNDDEYFNPRTPYGMRLLKIICSFVMFLFQSTHPLRDATCLYSSRSFSTVFQSTHPLRDATSALFSHATQGIFQSTHPLRDATVSLFRLRLYCHISIHAPLTGCDSFLFETSSYC